MTKTFKVSRKRTARFRLTITPGRVTVKYQINTTDEDRRRVVEFFKWVSEQPDMENCAVSFRGDLAYHKDYPLKINMKNENRTIRHKYTETA